MNYVFAPPEVPSIEVQGGARFPLHRIYCVGRNYAEHAREMGSDPTREPPFFFSKPADAVVPNNASVPYPALTKNFHHEVELVVALGSGGLFGKGFLLGTQSHLNFLPEKQTDFIFTMLAEELGLVGGLILLGLYTLVFVYGFAIALRSRNHFGRLLGLGITINFFLYVFINTAMVMGLIPVVGVPLPLISYGGTAMLTVMFGFGLLMSVYIHRDVRVSRFGESAD